MPHFLQRNHMDRELELKLSMYLSTKLAAFIGEQINLLTIEHEISYDEGMKLARSSLELNLSVYRELNEGV